MPRSHLRVFALFAACAAACEYRLELTPGPSAAGGGAGGGAAIAGGGGATEEDAGVDAGGGGGAAGGGLAGGGSAGGGSTGGGTGSTLCPDGLTCGDVTGKGDLECLDNGAPYGFPRGARGCDSASPCPTDFTCYVTDMGAETGACLQRCGSMPPGGAGGGSPAVLAPFFRGASPLATSDGGTTLTVASASTATEVIFQLAVVVADEGTGQRTLTAPAGWTAVLGWPIHNVSSMHTKPPVPPATQNHGLWLFHRFADATSTSADFVFDAPTRARAVVLAYEGVHPTMPIAAKIGGTAFGNGITNAGSGNSQQKGGRVVTVIGTGTLGTVTSLLMPDPPYHRTLASTEEQPTGLHLGVSQSHVSRGVYLNGNHRFREFPSNRDLELMFTVSSLVLRPK